MSTAPSSSSPSSSARVGVVTGAASGIGLAISKHLISQGWRVALADIDEAGGLSALATLPGDSAIFIRTDVSSWDDQAALFKAAWDKWGRIDFHAANAGIADREQMFGPTGVPGDESTPRKPNVQTIEVDLLGPVYGTWLAVHYFRRNPGSGGRVVITSSPAGLYPMAQQPQYAAAKHALVGFTRSMGPNLLGENITVNTILPGFVATSLAPKELLAVWPEKHTTPMSTILKAYDLFINDGTKTGLCGECSVEEIYMRPVLDYPDESQRWIGVESMKLWDKAYGVEK